MEQKPVAFTVPFFLAAAFILAVVMFLSLCDPKPHHAAEGHGHEGGQATEAHHDAAAPEHHDATAPATAVESTDSMPAETTEPAAEPAHH
jgi:hypothetical protein